MSNSFKSLDVVALETVTGGTASNDQLLTTLKGIQGSLADLSKPAQSTNTMMFMMMAVALSRPAAPSVVYVGRRGWW